MIHLLYPKFLVSYARNRKSYKFLALRTAIAYQILERTSESTRVRFATTFCAPNDAFSRVKGRMIATGRMQSQHAHEVTFGSELSDSQVQGEIIDRICNDPTIRPSRWIATEPGYESDEDNAATIAQAEAMDRFLSALALK